MKQLLGKYEDTLYILFSIGMYLFWGYMIFLVVQEVFTLLRKAAAC